MSRVVEVAGWTEGIAASGNSRSNPKVRFTMNLHGVGRGGSGDVSALNIECTVERLSYGICRLIRSGQSILSTMRVHWDNGRILRNFLVVRRVQPLWMREVAPAY